MDETRILADVFRDVGQECDDVVIEGALEFIDAFDGEGGPLADHGNCLARDKAEFGLRLAGIDFHVEPCAEFCVVSPERAHLGARVTCDHGIISP